MKGLIPKRNPNRIKMSLDSRIVTILAYVIVGAMSLLVVIPFLHVVAKGFSSSWAVFSGSVGLLPVDFTLDAMKTVLSSKPFHTALFNSILVTGVGTVSAVCFSALVAYPLSRKKLPMRRFWLLFFVFTMYFSGGLIPTYLLYNSYHLLNTRLILFLPHIINTYHLLIIKNYYEELPDAIFESAEIDGAGHWTIFTKIVVPLSKPAYATIAVFTSVILWNSYLGPKMYINSSELSTISLYLNDLIRASQDVLSEQAAASGSCPEAVTSAAIIACTIPILAIYPFMQKYFIKGMTIGSTKG